MPIVANANEGIMDTYLRSRYTDSHPTWLHPRASTMSLSEPNMDWLDYLNLLQVYNLDISLRDSTSRHSYQLESHTFIYTTLPMSRFR
jgi:hypothetical protein